MIVTEMSINTNAATASSSSSKAATPTGRASSTVRHGNIETYPVFTQSLKDVRCCDGDSVTLQCHVEALPVPSVAWEKDGKVLGNTCDIQIDYRDDRATLKLRRVYPEDEGEYTCVAINNIGKAYTSACVIVDGECIEWVRMEAWRSRTICFSHNHQPQCPKKKRTLSVAS